MVPFFQIWENQLGARWHHPAAGLSGLCPYKNPVLPPIRPLPLFLFINLNKITNE